MKKEFVTPEIDCSQLIAADCIMASAELAKKSLFSNRVEDTAATLDPKLYMGDDVWI